MSATTPMQLLQGWLERQLDAPARAWLRERLEQLAQARGELALDIAFGLAPRKLGNADLNLDDADLHAAGRVRPGWQPRGWSVAQAARVLMLLHSGGAPERFAARFERLCLTADVAELIALYRGLPLYPEPGRYRARAGEGVRSNMRPVFEAVAHHNPYPCEQFDTGAWNQMVLKALFIGSSLSPIVDLDRRANAALAPMLCDYAHERWAASRKVSPQLWRCVGPFADDAALIDLARVLALGGEDERAAAVLALSACPIGAAGKLLDAVPDLAAAVRRGALRWDTLPVASEPGAKG